jgi:hypothetical protein
LISASVTILSMNFIASWPSLDGHVHTVLSELSRKVQDPFLVLVRTPTIRNKCFGIRCHGSPGHQRDDLEFGTP